MQPLALPPGKSGQLVSPAERAQAPAAQPAHQKAREAKIISSGQGSATSQLTNSSAQLMRVGQCHIDGGSKDSKTQSKVTFAEKRNQKMALKKKEESTQLMLSAVLSWRK